MVVGRGAAAAAAAEQIHAAPGPARGGTTTVGVEGLFFVAAGHQSAPPLVGQAMRGERALALAGSEHPHCLFEEVWGMVQWGRSSCPARWQTPTTASQPRWPSESMQLHPC